MDLLERVTERAKEFFSESKGSHGWDHTLRVYNLCTHIGEKEGAYMETLKMAAILHDISRDEQDRSKGKICHAEHGGKKGRKLLEELGIGKDKIDKVIHCIETHRFRGTKIPESLEAKILFDADKLDCIGAVGIGRVFLFAGEIGARLHDKNVDVEKTKSYSKEGCAYREYLVKLRKIKDRIQTEEGKRLAEERHLFMKGFFERLNKEVEGDL